MSGDATASTRSVPPGGDGGGDGQIAALMLRDGLLTPAELRHAERVQARLTVPKPLVPLLLELGLLSREGLQATLQRHRFELRIGTLLVELGHLPAAAVERALAIQREMADDTVKVGEILVSLGVLAARELAQALSSQLGVPCIPVDELEADPALLARIPLDACRRHRLLPLREDGDQILVAFADPLDKRDAAAAKAFLSAEITPRIVATDDLDQAFTRLEVSAQLAEDAGAGESTAARCLEEILEAALRDGASHVHVEPNAKRVRVRMRRDGALLPWRELPPSLAGPLLQRVAQEAGVATGDGAARRDGRFSRTILGSAVHARAAFLRTGADESLTLALSREPAGPLPLDVLGLLPSMRSRLEEGPLSAPGSLLLVAGPPGSGRHATLRACAACPSDAAVRVVRFEDDGTRSADGAALDEDWLEASLRQDPDVVVLGLLRQPAELAAALRAARAGVRVLAALEAEDAIAGLFAAAHAARAAGTLLPALTAVLAQRLVRRVCEACAEPELPAAADLRRLGCTPADLAGGRFRRGRGCPRCAELGTAGRIGVFELHVLDEDARDPAYAAGETASLRRRAAQAGPATLLEDGLLKAARGVVPLAELVRSVPRSIRPRSLTEIWKVEGETR